MKKYVLAFLICILMTPGFIFSDLVSFHIGYYIPRAEGDLWDKEFKNLSFTKSDFHNTVFHFSYEYFLSPQISLTLSMDSYNKQKVGSYLGYVGYQTFSGDWAYPDMYTGEFDPSHALSVSNTPIQASIKFLPLGRTAKVIPYVGGGAGVFVWTVSIRGDIIDFSDERYDSQEEVIVYPIYQVNRRGESKFALGFHGFGGVMIPIANRISVDGGFRFSVAEGNLTDEFYTEFLGVETLDLSGYIISIGINYWF
ncbi:MAG: hypothetical protein R6V02_08345 [Candidatus Aminicenantes bacterium]